MIITGDRDTVPGLVTDWHDHLLPVRTSPAGDKFGVTYKGASHELVGHPDDPNFTDAITTSTGFLQAYALNKRTAKASLSRGSTATSVNWLSR
jgi:hypothetical protein